MKIPTVVVWSTRLLLNSLLVFFLIPAAASGGRVSCQEKRVVKESGSSTEINTYNEIPEATEPCTPEECAWWKQIRDAGNILLRKGDEKSKTKFALLLLEGMQKAYRIPLKDRPPQVLAFGRPAYSELTLTRLRRARTNGAAELSVEFRADGSIGDVNLIKGLDQEFDKSAVQAARQNLFLPAVRNGAFVTDWQKGEMKFCTRSNC
jgi:hypothetical protein